MRKERTIQEESKMSKWFLHYKRGKSSQGGAKKF